MEMSKNDQIFMIVCSLFDEDFNNDFGIFA